MSSEKKATQKKHFLETASGFERLLADASKEVPSEVTLLAIRDYNIRAGKLNLSRFGTQIPGTAGYYLNFILSAEQKSNNEAAKELGVTVQDLKSLEGNLNPVKDHSLFEFCTMFVREHPQFRLRALFTLLKRAIVLHSMSSGESVIRKAARKKPKK